MEFRNVDDSITLFEIGVFLNDEFTSFIQKKNQ